MNKQKVQKLINRVCERIAEDMPEGIHIQVGVTWPYKGGTEYSGGGVGNGLAREKMLEHMLEDAKQFNRDLRCSTIFEWEDDEDDDENF